MLTVSRGLLIVRGKDCQGISEKCEVEAGKVQYSVVKGKIKANKGLKAVE